MKKMILLSLAAVLMASPFTEARTKKSLSKMTAQVVSCHDGDTCRMSHNQKILKVRFAGIDAPELKQQGGKEAQRFLESQIKDKTVNLECLGTSYDRITCTVFLTGTNINQKMVESGFAWDSPKYSKGEYDEAMKKAKSAGVGIWKNASTSPYCFRHKSSKKCRVSQMVME